MALPQLLQAIKGIDIEALKKRFADNVAANKEFEAKKTAKIDALAQQILGQGLTSKWSGGFGVDNSAKAMAKLMVDAGITDIKQFGKVAQYEPVELINSFYNGQQVRTQTDEEGKTSSFIYEPTGKMITTTDGEGVDYTYPETRMVAVPKDAKLENVYGVARDAGEYGASYDIVDPSKIKTVGGKLVGDAGKTTFGNKETGKEIVRGTGRWQRQGGDNLFSGTGAGDGNTGFRVQFGDDGTPYFYTTRGSSNDLAMLMEDLGPIGQIGLAVATGGMSLPAQIATNMAIQVLSGKDLDDAIKNAAVSIAVAQIPGTDFMKDVGVEINKLGLDPSIAKTVNNAAQNAAMSATRAALTGQDVFDAALKGAATGGVNGAVGEIVKGIPGSDKWTPTQQKMAVNAITGVISGKPMDQILVNSAIAAANAEIHGSKNQPTGDSKPTGSNVTDTLKTAGLEDGDADGDADVVLPPGIKYAGANTGTTSDAGGGVNVGTVSGRPIYAEDSRAANLDVPFGYRLLSANEEKPTGAFYDATTNAWLSPETDVTKLFTSSSIQADMDLFNKSKGDLDEIAKTTADASDDAMADFLRSIGITTTDQLADSGLSNQDILNQIYAGSSDSAVIPTGGSTDTTGLDTGPTIPTGGSTDTTGLDTGPTIPTGGSTDTTGLDTGPTIPTPPVDDKGEVIIKGGRETCPVGTKLNPVTGECDPYWDEGNGDTNPTDITVPKTPTTPTTKPPTTTPATKPTTTPATKPTTTPTTKPAVTAPTGFVPSVGGAAMAADTIDPIYAGEMGSFNLFATLPELLAEETAEKTSGKAKDKTKMATGGHLDDLLAQQMTVDDLLNLLR